MDVLAHHDTVNCKLTVLYILSKLVTVDGRNKLLQFVGLFSRTTNTRIFNFENIYRFNNHN